MATTQAPNHPVHLVSLFKPLNHSVPEAVRANQYGNVNTESFFSCSGIDNSNPQDFEVTLTTNTALSNVLEPATIYQLAGKLIALNDGTTPIVIYNQSSMTKICSTADSNIDMTNKANVVGLGMVTHRNEVTTVNSEGGTHLEVTVSHNDWLSKVLYVVGRKVEISGSLVGFEMDTHMAIVQVIDVSVTSGHHMGKQPLAASTSVTKRPGKARNIVKFSPNKASGSTPTPKLPNEKESFSSPTPCSSKAKGKRKAKESREEDTKEETGSESKPSESDHSPDKAPPPAKKSRGRPRKAIIKDAARQLKYM
ncbi:hypothetical protein PTTG_09256 [Puccinia triticina 1-1 BBBD Race 1]|uniref:Uncharacterized protein n=1 Tax=Puccinia triticina (isolate 1-1 / race 1 (BBBD)) TaxID=630390 RepID=A0A180GRN8_PUCT1|nr:hypothetical protein PTTG_09256 [Puccinia triticina 1-1 BBBD Race 1]